MQHWKCHPYHANRASSANLFQAGHRHYVKGAVHERVEGLFYIPKMEQPKKVNGEWETTKYRLTVKILDSKKNPITVTYVEFGHTPLHESCDRNRRGVAKHILQSCIDSKIKA